MSFSKRSFAAAALSFAVLCLLTATATAQSVWTSNASDAWSVSTNWNGGVGPAPTSGDTTQLVFNADNATSYTATNDFGPFTLNAITFNNTGTGLITLAGADLTLAGVNPAIISTGAGSATITNSIVYAPNTAVTNSGAGTLTLSGQTFANGVTFTNSGAGTLVLADAVTYAGSNVTINLANTGTGTFNIGNLTAGVTGTLNVTAGTVKFAGATAGDLFSDGLILNVASGATFDFANNGEGFGGISGGGNIVLGSAAVSFVAPGDRTYTGAISGTGAVTQNNSGVLSLGGANTYTGNTTIQAGGTIRALGNNTLSSGSAVIIAAGQGTLDLNGFSQTVAGLSGAQLVTNIPISGASTFTINGSGTGVRTYNGLFSGTGNLVVGGTAVQNITGVNTYTGSTTVNGGTLRINATGLQSSGGVTVNANGTLDAVATNDVTWTAPLSGTGNLVKSGPATLTFAAPTAASPVGLTINKGTLVVDHAANNAAKFANTPALTLGSGTLSVAGNDAAPTTETFGGTTLTGGATVAVTSGASQNATVNLGAITRRVGSAINFKPTNTGSGVAAITTTTPNAANGTLGGYAVVNGTDWAVTGTGAGPFNVAPLPAASYTSNTWSAGTHTDVTSNFTIPAAGSTADVRFNTPVPATLSLVGTNNVSSGGILVTPNVGANETTISGGNLTAPANQELFVNQFNPARFTAISSVISNTPGTPVVQTVGNLGTGTTVTVPSTAGIFPGMLVTNTTNLPAASNAHVVSVNSPTSITISFTTAPTAGSAVPLTFTPGTYVVKNGPGTLVLTATNTFNGSLVLNDGVVSAGAIGNLGSSATATGTSSVIFNGGTLRLTGAFSAGSAVQPYIFGPGGGTIDVANAGQRHTKQGNSISGSGTLTKTGPGELSIGSNGSAFNGQVVVNGGVLLFQSNQFQSAQGITVNPGGQYQINDDAVNGNFNIVTGGVLSLAGNGPAGSTTPGAFALTDQGGGTTGPTSVFGNTDGRNAVYLAADAVIATYNSATAGRTSTLVFTGPVTGPGNLLKTGGGTLVLNNAFNTYGNGAGMTAISNGTVRIGGNNRLPTGTTLQFGEVGSTNNGTFDLNGFSQTVAGLTTVGSATGHQIINAGVTAVVPTLTVNYNGATPETFGGQIGGAAPSLALVKAGTGTLVLTGNNSYNGPTTVAGGTLRVVSNTVPRPYTVADTARLDVINQLPTDSFAMSALTLGATGGASTLGFDFTAGTPTNGLINVSTPNGLTANGAVNVSLSSAQPLTVGTIPLIKYNGTIQGAGFGAFSAGTLTLPSRVFGALVNNTANSSVDLNVTGVDFIKWTGANSADWNINTTQNWKLNSNNAPTTYLESPAPGDSVVFDESAPGPHTVNLTTTLTPSAVTVSGPSDYTFTGPGKLTGPAGLTKAGAGTLTLLTDNTNTGPTTISGGTLQVGNGGTTGALGSGSVADNGSLVFNRSDDVTFAPNISGTGTLVKNGPGTLALTGGFSLSGNTTINAGTLALTGGTYAGNISGAGALAKTGVGTLVLTGAATHTGGTNITAGTLQLGNGGTSGSLAGNVTFDAGATLAFNRSDDATFAGNITGGGGLENAGTGKTLLTGTLNYTGTTVVSSGTLEFGAPAADTTLNGKVSGTGTIVKSGAGTLTFLNSNTAFTGTLIVNGGTVLLDDLTAGGDLNAHDITVNSGGKFILGEHGNADLPEGQNGAYVTVNTGGEFEIRQGEVWSALRLRGGTFRLTGNNAAIGSTANADPGGVPTPPFSGYALESGTIVAANTGAGSGTLTGNVTKTTPGTVTFSGKVAVAAANTISILDGALAFDAATNVPAGTGILTLGDASNAATTGVFRVTGAGAATTARPVFVPTSGAVDVTDPAGALTLTGDVSGGGTLDKTGPGTLRIAPSLNFSGTLNVRAGTLRTTSGNTPSNYTVANGATLAVASPGDSPLPFAVNGLTLGNTASNIAFELGTSATPGFPLIQVLNPNGLVTGGGTHSLSLSNTQTLTPGQFTLIDYDGTPITSGFTLGNLPARTNAALVYNTANTSIDLNVIGIDSTLWNGTISADWDLGTAADVGGTKNFKLASNGNPTNFITNDRVTFDDSAAGTTTVNLTTALQPAAVTVNNTAKTYTFGGPGSITGSTGLTKDGAGTLIVTTDNTYTGATTINAGTLQVGNGGATGSFTSPVTVAPGATLAFNRSNDQTYAGVISGSGAITKAGAGTLTLLAASPFNGTLTVDQGTVLLDDLGAGGDLNATSIVVNNGAAFVFGENGNADLPNATVVTVNTGGLFDLKQGEVYGGLILKGGTYQMTGGVRTAIDTTAQPANGYLFESGTVTTNFTGAATGGGLLGTTFLDKTTPGTVTISGAVTIGDAVSVNIREGTLSFGVANVPAAGTTTIAIGDSATAGTLQVRDAGNAASARPITIGDGGGTVDIANAGGTLTFANTVSGTAAATLTKTGPGSLVLSGTNDYAGPTVVSGGTLRVTSSIASSSAVTVNAGGTFQAAASQTIKKLTVNTGGKLDVALSPAASKKVLTVVGDTPSVSGTGFVDLHNNGIVFDYATSTPLASIRGLIANGNAQNWAPGANPAIGSSEAAAAAGFAIGYAEASDLALPPTGFMGQPVDGTSVVARFTLFGDATLDGAVDFNDLVKLAQNYNTTVSATTGDWWANGDFTYDGLVDFNDLVKLAQNYNSALPADPVPGAGATFNNDLAAAFAAVPEPGAITLLAATALAISRRRRK